MKPPTKWLGPKKLEPPTWGPARVWHMADNLALAILFFGAISLFAWSAFTLLARRSATPVPAAPPAASSTAWREDEGDVVLHVTVTRRHGLIGEEWRATCGDDVIATGTTPAESLRWLATVPTLCGVDMKPNEGRSHRDPPKPTEPQP